MSLVIFFRFCLITTMELCVVVPSLNAQEQEPLSPIVLIRQWANRASATNALDGSPPDEISNHPDSFGCGDLMAAWAYHAPESTTLSVYFPQAVVPTQLNIYDISVVESIQEVRPIPLGGDEVAPISISSEPFTGCMSIFSINLPARNFPQIKGVEIVFNQEYVGTPISIDAIELVGIGPDTAAQLHKAELVVYHQWANTAEATSQYTDTNWSAAQATGAPDTFQCGDIASAWASRNATSDEQLVVKYELPVIPLEVNIRQTYNPGAIIRVTLLPFEQGDPIFLSNSTDPGTECPGIFTVTLPDPASLPRVDGIIISLDQMITGNWNEIDAVELIGLANP